VNGSPGHVGRRFPPQSFGPVTRTDFVRYAGASGDFNPMHHDEPYAVKAGNPSVFSMGMFQAGLLSSYATKLLGARNIRRFTVRFRERVWPGDTLTCSATVTASRSRWTSNARTRRGRPWCPDRLSSSFPRTRSTRWRQLRR
jgi:acyl dehydratase